MGEIRKELRNWLNQPSLQPSEFIPVNKPQPITKDRLKVIKAASSFKVVEEHLYLERRGIKRNIQKSDRFYGTVAIDSRGNAIFPHYDGDGLTGYSAKNTNFTGFSSGGTKTLWQSNQSETDRSLVITESAIDAMSYHQLFGKDNPHTRYIATSGTMSNYQLELIETAMKEITKLGGEIVIATDNDEMGNKMAKTLVDVAPEHSKVYRHQPQYSKDWNEAVDKERQRILSQQKQQKRSRGLEL
ncbi:MAG TPA: toprim domain-containing protein [Xenococcaceae cyanobacterium]